MTREQFISQVESTQGALRRFLVALCSGDALLADDIAQEAYIKAWLAADSLHDAAKFRQWLYRIGYNTFINHRRSARPSAGYDEAAALASDTTTDATFRYQALYAALDRLPANERSAVLLYYMEGYAVKEIAEIQNTSPDAVRQHLSRGRNHLRHLIDPKQDYYE